MLVRIGICDDNPEDILDLSKALYAYEPSFEIATYSDGESLLDDCKDPDVIFDLLFMDINMPGMNGITTAGEIRSHLLDVKIIFISSSNEHYPEAYDVFAFNYMIKPVNPEKLRLILDQALAGMILERRQKYFFSYKNVNYQIFVRDILYMESSEKLIYFHMSNGSHLMCYTKLDEVLKQMPSSSFVRCHQSFVVNFFHVTEMAGNYFRIGPETINISRKYLKAAKESYFKHLFHYLDRGN
ncbi:MAG: LytTR family DNA-binding domain-containing protein [Bacillota bacterium]|nr:LytTR family DNA-binding domain-containing protein [Bacillota bacterium]